MRAAVAVCWPGLLGVILLMVAMSLPQNLESTTMLAGGGGLLLLGSLLLGLIVGLFNRPKAVIPPPYRECPGALAEWALRRRRGRANSLKRRQR